MEIKLQIPIFYYLYYNYIKLISTLNIFNIFVSNKHDHAYTFKIQ